LSDSPGETLELPGLLADPELAGDWEAVRSFLKGRPSLIREDAELLSLLGLWVKADNVVEFGPAALARLSAAKSLETNARQQLESTARANFAAQAQTHAAVCDLLESRNHSDLARRIDETARLRFGLSAGVIAIETPGGVPAGWIGLEAGMTDQVLGYEALTRMGQTPYTQHLFGSKAEEVQSAAMIRLAIWAPARQGVLAFGSPDPRGFSRDMGSELVAFLARVVERTAERWPVL
jgi:hypothetical protein